MPHDIRSDPATAEITSETIEVLHNRVSTRKYSQEPVTEAQVKAILDAAFRAPTSSNIQAYSVIVVRDPEVKKELAVLTGNQKHVAECPVYLQFCADLTRMEAAMMRHGHNMDNNNLEYGLVSSIDAALVGMSAYLAAEFAGHQGPDDRRGAQQAGRGGQVARHAVPGLSGFRHVSWLARRGAEAEATNEP